ncbi:lysylphosphatidylglycerol synthase transmembrane domain-containing protein [Paraclostridium sordellii]|uniref:Phosphatidylglycerol lysyltransferase n=1 Tax=Paraclostridium sordellii TaxID=1505 RepID=A0ABP1XVX1_PARSO|nr:lysylphosphatidylglycerol synthase transmembrane domain-containing protein [Paeniclostridium sordellii]AUN14165.1 TIGR00374 family protein [Paeniclostridium sordellii]EPZ56340.1 TIGR00374 family protein [[Clostridium] sordellii VPI 9048] [Paeniclostridium sordellii VPI 9048]MBS6022798.1 flippase-like domain-containing protein [Paeniclostridium sordellii]MBX9179861.1 flippase-like domain-containing protein [Paeniclostridium sordellii]MDU2686826.1 lysylphosphatidylglycerol synthase transmembr
METKKFLNKNIIQYSFLVFILGITSYLVYKTLDINMLGKVVKMVDKKFIFLGMCAVIAHMLLEGLVLKIVIDSIHKVQTRFIGFKLATMGFYYNLITPFASGSQPMQIYVLNKCKMPASKATAVIMNKSIIYQVVVTVYCSILVLLNTTILKELRGIMPLILIGIAINAFTLIMSMLVIYNPEKVKVATKFVIKRLAKFKLFKFLETKIDKIENFADEYSTSVNLFIKNKKALFLTTIITVIQLSVYFSISFWIYKAFNLTGHTYVHMLTLQAFLYMAISPIPTPGNAGASELAFFAIFKSVFPKPLMGYAVFLYGGFVYYAVLVGSGIFTMITHHTMKKKVEKVKENIKNESKEYVV